MSSMSSALPVRETNRLHRWAMWRMTVNEGIISCIRDNGTTRVIYPDSSSDSSNSLNSDVVPDFHEFPFITPEQMSLARKLNLREKYGSAQGLSDDAYFIFGLPRINIGKDIPEVTSTGTRSVYESFSELGDPVNTASRGMTGTTADNNNGGALNATYSELGPTPDSQSLASHNDMEVQRINGYREEGWKNQAAPVPRPNLYSIQEEHNNNNSNNNVGETTTGYFSNHYPDREGMNPYTSNRYTEADTIDRYSSQHGNFQEAETTNCYRGFHDTGATNRFSDYQNTSKRFSSDSYSEDERTRRYLPNSRYQEEITNPSRRFLEGDSTNRYTASSRYQERDISNSFQSSGYNQDEPMPTYSVKEAIDRYEAANRSTSPSGPMYYTRQTSSRSNSSDRFNRNIKSPPFNSSQDIYPPFSHTRQQQNSRSPNRRSYSPLPSSPRQSHSPLPTSGYPASPTYSKQNYSTLPAGSPRKSSVPSGGGGSGVGSPGYGSKMRPTRLMSDGEAERMKRQAYYDWTTPVNERCLADFTAPARYG